MPRAVPRAVPAQDVLAWRAAAPTVALEQEGTVTATLARAGAVVLLRVVDAERARSVGAWLEEVSVSPPAASGFKDVRVPSVAG